MQSKTSFFNPTLFRKHMTRFAPLWLVYTLCLLLGMVLMYMEGGMVFWFGNRMGEMIRYSSLINLIYAPVVAMLLFGDLYNSRMCYALHAMPMKRSCWYGTNLVTGLVFSLLPTAIFCGLSIPLLLHTYVVNGWQIALWTFLGMNLTYLCFFGIAVFSALCVGNRFGMVAMYAILNGGAYVAYFLIDSIYTPMLYGIITPTTLLQNLTPIANLMEAACLELDNYNELLRQAGNHPENIIAHYHLLSEGWLTVSIWAIVGTAFLVLGNWMYKGRKLECAGDTMAVKALEPVFQVAISLCAAAFFSIFIDLFIGSRFRENWQYLFLGSGLLVGWFAGRMLLERTVRVFRFKNFLGLAALAAVLAGTLAMTHYDVFGIETWKPKAEDVKSVTFGYSMYRGMSEELTEKSDIEAVLRLQELALEDRLEEGGSIPFLDGRQVTYEEADERRDEATFRYASDIYIDYVMNSGKIISRKYIVWGDEAEADIVNEYLSRWEVVSRASYYGEMAIETAASALGQVGDLYIQVSGSPAKDCTQAELEELEAAIRADCEARTMTQRTAFHTGHFEYLAEYGEWVETRSIWLELVGENSKSGSFSVFADSENTLAWLEDHGLLSYEVHADNGYDG